MRPIPQTAFAFIDRVERCILRVYDDARPDYILMPNDKVIGTLTAGRGHTGFICIGDPVNQARADEWTWRDLRDAGEALEHKAGADVIALLTDNQYSALLSFVFNCGTGNPNKAEWNIWRVLRAKQFAQVPLELSKFVNGKVDKKTVKIKGLVRRRNLEIELWSTGEPGSVDADIPSSSVREMITPPTPVDPTPVMQSKPVIAGALAAVSAMPVAFSQVHNAVAPLAHNPHSAAVAAISAIGAISAGASVLFSYLHNKTLKT